MDSPFFTYKKSACKEFFSNKLLLQGQGSDCNLFQFQGNQTSVNCVDIEKKKKT